MNAKPVSSDPAPALSTGELCRLDEQALARLRLLDPDGSHGVLVRVLRTYEASLQRMLGQLTQAAGRQDDAAVAALAHTLKSSSASVGALVLSELCASAERDLRVGPVPDLPALADSISAEVERVLTLVRAMLQP